MAQGGYFSQYRGGFSYMPQNYAQVAASGAQAIGEGLASIGKSIGGAMIGNFQNQGQLTAMKQQFGPTLELAQRYATATGQPLPASLQQVNVSEMTLPQMQGTMAALDQYNTMAPRLQAIEAAKIAQAQAMQQAALQKELDAALMNRRLQQFNAISQQSLPMPAAPAAAMPQQAPMPGMIEGFNYPPQPQTIQIGPQQPRSTYAEPRR
jgi:hypothetical protein